MYILRTMATVSSLCHYPGTRVFPPEIRTLTPCSKGQAVGTQGVVWLLGTPAATLVLLRLHSIRETGACTESAGPWKEAWQWVTVQRNRDLGLGGCVDNRTRHLLHGWLRKTLIWILARFSDLQFLVCTTGGLKCHLRLQRCPCRLFSNHWAKCLWVGLFVLFMVMLLFGPKF